MVFGTGALTRRVFLTFLWASRSLGHRRRRWYRAYGANSGVKIHDLSCDLTDPAGTVCHSCSARGDGIGLCYANCTSVHCCGGCGVKVCGR